MKSTIQKNEKCFKKTCLGFLGLFLVCSALICPVHAAESDDIAAIIKELDYLIEYTAKAQQNNAKETQLNRVGFNYNALLEQLKTTRERTAEYFNASNVQFDLKRPSLLDRDLIQIDAPKKKVSSKKRKNPAPAAEGKNQ